MTFQEAKKLKVGDTIWVPCAFVTISSRVASTPLAAGVSPEEQRSLFQLCGGPYAETPFTAEQIEQIEAWAWEHDYENYDKPHHRRQPRPSAGEVYSDIPMIVSDVEIWDKEAHICGHLAECVAGPDASKIEVLSLLHTHPRNMKGHALMRYSDMAWNGSEFVKAA